MWRSLHVRLPSSIRCDRSLCRPKHRKAFHRHQAGTDLCYSAPPPSIYSSHSDGPVSDLRGYVAEPVRCLQSAAVHAIDHWRPGLPTGSPLHRHRVAIDCLVHRKRHCPVWYIYPDDLVQQNLRCCHRRESSVARNVRLGTHTDPYRNSLRNNAPCPVDPPPHSQNPVRCL